MVKLQLILEYMPGGDCKRALLERGMFSRYNVKRFVMQMASALAYVHRHMIAHRDTKLENILCDTTTDGLMLFKIGDFGFSHYAQALHGCTTVVGTPEYMAPEVLKGSGLNGAYGYQSDVWSLGICAYMLITGECPYNTDCLNTQIVHGLIVWHSDPLLVLAQPFLKLLLCLRPEERATSSALCEVDLSRIRAFME